MEINVVTVFPEMFKVVSEFGITRQAMDSGELSLGLYNPRDYTANRHRMVDDRPYGGGPGMVFKPEPLAQCIDEARKTGCGPVIYLSPQGERLDQPKIRALSVLSDMILVCGRYEGIDERIVTSRIDMEISIGDYVLAGGEFPAMVLIDAVARLLPGVLGNAESANQDSFSESLLDYPHYTRPAVFEGVKVPDVLLSGDHEKIRRWRSKQSRERTEQRRPDLLKKQDQVKE